MQGILNFITVSLWCSGSVLTEVNIKYYLLALSLLHKYIRLSYDFFVV